MSTIDTSFRITHAGDHYFYVEQGALTLSRVTPGWLRYAAPGLGDTARIAELLGIAFTETFGDINVSEITYAERKNLQSLALEKFSKLARLQAVNTIPRAANVTGAQQLFATTQQ